MGYWTGVDYLGIGLGSSSYVSGFRFSKERDLKTYLEMAGEPGFPSSLYQHIERLDTRAKMEEFMFLGLRLTKGVSGSQFLERFGQNMWNVYGDTIGDMEQKGLMIVEYPQVRLTPAGVDVSNYVMSKFLLD